MFGIHRDFFERLYEKKLFQVTLREFVNGNVLPGKRAKVFK